MKLSSLIPDGPPLIFGPEISSALASSRHVIRRMVARGNLPRPVRLSRRRLAFSRAEVREALDRLQEQGLA